MTDGQKLKDCLAEFRKANKTIDDNLKKAEERVRQSRQELEAQSSRQ